MTGSSGRGLSTRISDNVNIISQLVANQEDTPQNRECVCEMMGIEYEWQCEQAWQTA